MKKTLCIFALSIVAVGQTAKLTNDQKLKIRDKQIERSQVIYDLNQKQISLLQLYNDINDLQKKLDQENLDLQKVTAAICKEDSIPDKDCNFDKDLNQQKAPEQKEVKK